MCTSHTHIFVHVYVATVNCCGGGGKEVGYLNDNGYQLTPLLGKYFDNI